MAAAIMAAHERRGDAVLYLSSNKRAFSMAYPAPYQQLRDLALAKSPLAAANLIGTQVPTRPPYLGGSGKFDQAIADFAEVYADQNERD